MRSSLRSQQTLRRPAAATHQHEAAGERQHQDEPEDAEPRAAARDAGDQMGDSGEYADCRDGWADGRPLLVGLFVLIEDLLYVVSEESSEFERERQRRQVATRLDRVDRLPRDSQRLGQGRLRQIPPGAQVAYSVAHSRSTCQASLSLTHA